MKTHRVRFSREQVEFGPIGGSLKPVCKATDSTNLVLKGASDPSEREGRRKFFSMFGGGGPLKRGAVKGRIEADRWDWTPLIHALLSALAASEDDRVGIEEMAAVWSHFDMATPTSAEKSYESLLRGVRERLVKPFDDPAVSVDDGRGLGRRIVWRRPAWLEVEVADDIRRAVKGSAVDAAPRPLGNTLGQVGTDVIQQIKNIPERERRVGLVLVVDVISRGGGPVAGIFNLIDKEFPGAAGVPRLCLRIVTLGTPAPELMEKLDSAEFKSFQAANKSIVTVQQCKGMCAVHGTLLHTARSLPETAVQGARKVPKFIRTNELALYLGASSPPNTGGGGALYDIRLRVGDPSGADWIECFHNWFYYFWMHRDAKVVFPRPKEKGPGAAAVAPRKSTAASGKSRPKRSR